MESVSGVYISEKVKDVREFYGSLLHKVKMHLTIAEHLEMMARKLWSEFSEGNPVSVHEINNYHPDYLGKSAKEVYTSNVNYHDIKLTIAKEYGFKNWEGVQKEGNVEYDHEFQTALDTMLDGDLETLKEMLLFNSDLSSRRSKYGHKATLLHYCASNGVEMWRQMVPYNLPDIVQLLLESGADPNAKIGVYGNYYRTIELLGSSIHPDYAGVKSRLVEILGDYL